jgi:hypothetical protein
MSTNQKHLHDNCLNEVEDFFMERVFALVDTNRIDDADAIHNEFVVDGHEPDDWLFINDLTNV